MRTSAFEFDLPSTSIAQRPLERREEARLLVVNRSDESFQHLQVADLPRLLQSGDTLVLNDTRVVPARLLGRKKRGGGRVELLFLEERSPWIWDVLMRASRRPRPGEVISLPGGAQAILLAEGERGRCTLRVESDCPVPEWLEAHGETPLPPYIHRRDADPELKAMDRERYQTVYARLPGAVAAPTAGLHFSPSLLRRLAAGGVNPVHVTLHVGPGTFRPVHAEQIEGHRMDSERFEVSRETAIVLDAARTGPGRIVAVGSTAVRTLETTARCGIPVEAGCGRTDLFIHPPFEFRLTDAMLTNLHLPRSTLLMMVCAFGGIELILRAYREAVARSYRFYSYGDAMLIL
jgi:S-adenosylmethionine:tRNA ribosyltransferase-isomerase